MFHRQDDLDVVSRWSTLCELSSILPWMFQSPFLFTSVFIIWEPLCSYFPKEYGILLQNTPSRLNSCWHPQQDLRRTRGRLLALLQQGCSTTIGEARGGYGCSTATVASLWLDGMCMPEGKTAKAFTRAKFICTKISDKSFSKLSQRMIQPLLFLGLQQFFLRKLPQRVVTLSTRNHQTPAGLYPLRRDTITESRETVKQGHSKIA